MKANELRIGNLVKWNDDDAVDSVLTITGTMNGGEIWVDWEWEDGQNDNTDCEITSVCGIALTEQWLKDLGFDLGKNKWWHKKYLAPLQEQICIISINMTYGSCSIGAEGFDSDINEIGPAYTRHMVMYVHQLQNLYFAITGEELTIKTK